MVGLGIQSIEDKIVKDPWLVRRTQPSGTIFQILSLRLTVQDSECREIMFKGRKRLYDFSLNVPQGLTLIIRQLSRFGCRYSQKCRVFHYQKTGL